ncbi:hypothetical protein [Nocardioides humi]|uniref:MgtE intracellular N domain-containing protein n=1 Tax=Nocardioides humi TaxID=449461 RepID=A0ABN2BPX1_9ACTN|nr:hypothetical protein [Nocardioides humi]
MAGRKLRRQREERLAALTDEQAVALAQRAMRKLNDSQVLSVLAAGSGADLRSLLRTPMDEVRANIAEQVTSNPAHARLVLVACQHLAVVEQGIGLTRTPGQQRRR